MRVCRKGGRGSDIICGRYAYGLAPSGGVAHVLAVPSLWWGVGRGARGTGGGARCWRWCGGIHVRSTFTHDEATASLQPPLPPAPCFVGLFLRLCDRETQVVLEDDLGLSPHVLGRGIFQGQHHLNGLLESTDAQLKEDLALLVRPRVSSVLGRVLACAVALACFRLRYVCDRASRDE